MNILLQINFKYVEGSINQEVASLSGKHIWLVFSGWVSDVCVNPQSKDPVLLKVVILILSVFF